MKYLVNAMNRDEAYEVSTWSYEGEYSIYNMNADDISELLDGSYYSVKDETDYLVGYFCFGDSAKVPAGNDHGAYKQSELIDIGLGINPILCGKGLGVEFLLAGIKFGEIRFRKERFRLTVAIFNERAKKVYRKVGFIEKMNFNKPTSDGEIEFCVMER